MQHNSTAGVSRTAIGGHVRQFERAQRGDAAGLGQVQGARDRGALSAARRSCAYGRALAGGVSAYGLRRAASLRAGRCGHRDAPGTRVGGPLPDRPEPIHGGCTATSLSLSVPNRKASDSIISIVRISQGLRVGCGWNQGLFRTLCDRDVAEQPPGMGSRRVRNRPWFYPCPTRTD